MQLITKNIITIEMGKKRSLNFNKSKPIESEPNEAEREVKQRLDASNSVAAKRKETVLKRKKSI